MGTRALAGGARRCARAAAQARVVVKGEVSMSASVGGVASVAGADRAAGHAGIDRVIEAFDEIVRSDGGGVSFVAVDDATLRVAYRIGHNEDCPTCVMEPDALGLMMHDMLREHAPEIAEVRVEVVEAVGAAAAGHATAPRAGEAAR